MTQYHQEQYYGQPGEDPYQQSPKTSGMAITALVLSLIGFVPCCGILTAPVGVVLGLIGVVRIGGNSMMKGKGLCVAAILLGTILTAAQIGIGYWGWGWIRPVFEGPKEAMTAASNGDIAGFKNHFLGAGATAPDAQAREFIETLEDRYGTFREVALDDTGGGPQPTQPGAADFNVQYDFVFANETVQGEAVYVIADQQSGQVVRKWESITIFDSERGDLTYPPSAAPQDGNGNGPSGAEAGAADGAADDDGGNGGNGGNGDGAADEGAADS